jgi:uncharacterized LabA/DUF88 family protein
MDKAAVFVDAGYLLAASAELITGSKSRSGIQVAYPALITELIDLVTHHGPEALLRVYWYDGARNAVPTDEQLVVARLPNVKLRLGRRTHWGQKGVDSLIVLDLTTLARERAMSTAYLISGDEDIREGVAAAQQLGVRVILLGVPTRSGWPQQADTLVREADEHITLDRAVVIDPHIRAAQPPPVVAPAAEGGIDAREVGRAFGAAWMGKATQVETDALRSQAPAIPRDLDAQLFRTAEQTLGALRGRLEARRELRAGFWDAVMNQAEPAADGAVPDPAQTR